MSAIEYITHQHKIESLRQQLAVKDLEVMQLMEVLGQANHTLSMVEHYQCCNKTVGGSCTCSLDKCKTTVSKELSTTFTPDNLMAWLGEPVAWVLGGELYLTKEDADNSKRNWTLVTNPLYAPKLDITK